MARTRLSKRQRQLVNQAAQCGIIGFGDGVDGQSVSIARALTETPQEHAAEMEAAIQGLLELTLSLRSLN